MHIIAALSADTIKLNGPQAYCFSDGGYRSVF